MAGLTPEGCRDTRLVASGSSSERRSTSGFAVEAQRLVHQLKEATKISEPNVVHLDSGPKCCKTTALRK